MLHKFICFIVISFILTACGSAYVDGVNADAKYVDGVDSVDGVDGDAKIGSDPCVVDRYAKSRTAEYLKLANENGDSVLDAACAFNAYDKLYSGEGQIVSLLSTHVWEEHSELGDSQYVTGLDAVADDDTVFCEAVCSTAVNGSNNHKNSGTRLASIIAGKQGGDTDTTNMHGIAYGAKIKAVAIFNDDGWGVDFETATDGIAAYQNGWTEAIMVKAIDAGSDATIAAMMVDQVESFREACVTYQDNPWYYFSPVYDGMPNNDCASNETIGYSGPSDAIKNAYIAAANKGTIIVMPTGGYVDKTSFNEGGLINIRSVKYKGDGGITPGSLVAINRVFDGADQNISSPEAAMPNYVPELEGKWLAVTQAKIDGTASRYANGCGDAMDYCITAPIGENIYAAHEKEGGDSVWNSDVGLSSYGAALVTGAIAMVKEAHPTMGQEELVNLLLDTATDIGDKGTDRLYGRGMLNLGAAFSTVGLKTVTTTNNVAIDALAGDTSLVLASHFGNGTQNMQYGMRDNYNRTFTVNANQVTRAPVTLGIDDYMANFQTQNQTGQADNHQLNAQTHLTFSDSANDNWLNLDYQHGNAVAFLAMYETYQLKAFEAKDTNAPTRLRAMNIRPSAKNMGLINVSHQLGASLSLHSYAAHGKYANGGETRSNQFSELGNDITLQKPDYAINLGFGHLREEDQFLGANGSGAYALAKPTLSRFADISVSRKLTTQGKFSLYGNYTAYETDVDMRYSEFADISEIKANQYHIGIKGTGILQDDDSIDIKLATKLGVTDGTLTQNTVLGYKDSDGDGRIDAFNNVHQSFDLASPARHQQLSFTYQGKLMQASERAVSVFSNNRFFTSLNIDRNLHNSADISQTEIIAGVTSQF